MSDISLGPIINHVISGKALTRQQAFQSMTRILKQQANRLQQGAFLAAITTKGPQPDEIAGIWQAIQEHATVQVRPRISRPLVDNCGTGMDKFKTFNISTAAAIVAAAGGVAIARHGARSITSRCGTVDICESLGINVACSAETVCRSIETVGIGLFNGMSSAIHSEGLLSILAEMQFGSILNIAASLANPAGPVYGVRGVYAAHLVVPVAQTMRAIGFQRALVFHGETPAGGMDELSPVGINHLAELTADGHIKTQTLTPLDLGVQFNGDLHSIAAGNHPAEEARRLRQVLAGRKLNPLAETVALNAAPLFYIAGELSSNEPNHGFGASRNLLSGLQSGLAKARELLSSGRAAACLEAWVGCQ